MKIENLRRITERGIDLFFRPNVKRPFGGLPAAGIVDPGYNAICVFRRKKTTFLGSHVASDVIKDVACD